MQPRLKTHVKALRPVDLGRTVGISPSLVRTYEQVGFLPAADRSPTGYRRYTDVHVEALRVARCLIAGYGWQRALQVMRAVHAGDSAAALAVADACHAELHRQRAQIDETLRTIERISRTQTRVPRVTAGRVVRIGAAAQLAGVRPSALRFWEEQGLLQPTRDGTTRSRYYDHEQMQRVQIVALLRAAGYRFDGIRSVLDDLATSRPAQALAALEQRRRSVQRASQQTMHATSALHGYLQHSVELDQPVGVGDHLTT
ncbi:MerR family transcriptional regulator [Actinopolymorpha sp. B11F2]